jgi:hypothetical protein
MNLFSIFLILFASVYFSYAQESTYKTEEKGRAEVLVMAFEPRMYMSQWDHELTQKNNMPSVKIKEFFREEIDRHFYKELIGKKTPLSLNLSSLEACHNDLNKFYESVQITFKDQVPGDNKPLKNKGELAPNTRKVNVVAVKTTNQNNIRDISRDYGAKYIIAINELDLLMPVKDAYDMSNKNFDIILKIHYTILTNKGEEIISNYSETNFPAGIFNLKEISENGLFPAVQKISNELLNLEAKSTVDKKN